MATRSVVVVPLYIYPVNSAAWAPLYTAVANNPGLDFLVIVNPNSGPGDMPYPNIDYDRELRKLNRYNNVSTIGYIRTGYCKRNIAEVLREVELYAMWSKEGATFGVFVEGIFLDEIPNHSSPTESSYLDRISIRIKTCSGILGKRLVVHNPGTIPDAILTYPCPDITAVFEESYDRYLLAGPSERVALQQFERANCCYIIHSVPAQDVQQLVLDLRRRAAYLFVTDLHQRMYNEFGQSWDDFIVAMQMP